MPSIKQQIDSLESHIREELPHYRILEELATLRNMLFEAATPPGAPGMIAEPGGGFTAPAGIGTPVAAGGRLIYRDIGDLSQASGYTSTATDGSDSRTATVAEITAVGGVTTGTGTGAAPLVEAGDEEPDAEKSAEDEQVESAPKPPADGQSDTPPIQP